MSTTVTIDSVTYTLTTSTSVNTASVTGNTLSSTTNVTIPSTITDGNETYTVTSIGDTAFTGSSYLASIVIPDTVTSIANGSPFNGAFSSCSALTAVIIGSGLTTMGSSAFQICGDTLTSMYFLGDYPSGINGSTFYGDNSLTLYYLDGASGWSSTVGGRTAVAITAGTTGVASITAFSDSNKTAAFSIADNSYTNVELVVLNGSSGVTSGKAFALSSGNWTVTSPALVDGDVVKVFLQTSSGATVTQLLSYDSTSQYYSVDLGVGIVSIGIDAFTACFELTAVIIGANVTSIGDYAFQWCSALTAVTISSGNTTFFNGSNGEVYQISDSTVSLFFCPRDKTSFTIPASVTQNGSISYTVTSIANLAFAQCIALNAVIIGANVTSIGDSAFTLCSALTAVTIPYAVTSIGQSAFDSCSKLTAVTIGANVTTIGSYAFYSCFALTAVIIPDAVTSIGIEAFYGCSALTAVTIGASVTSIGDGAFNECSALTAVTIPDAVTTIGEGAFRSCYKLTAVIIGANVTTIGTGAFRDCDNTLTSMYFLGDLPSGIDGTTFEGDDSLTLYYLDGASGWSSTVGGRTAVAITAGTTGVASITNFNNSTKTATFSIANNSYTNVELVVLNGSSGVTSGKAFAKSLNGTSWTVTSPALVNGDVVKVFLQTSTGATVTQLLSYSYNSNSTYYSVDLGVGIVSIGIEAFTACSELTAVTIGANVTSIGNSAFYSCSKLTAITIPDAVTSIGIDAFNACFELTAVIIGANVTTIDFGAFNSCSKLTAVIIPDAVTSIGISAFNSCSKLTAVIIGANVTVIGDIAFNSCSKLTAVTIGASVTSIGVAAFQGCTSLISIPVSSTNTVLYNDPSDNGVIYQISNGVASLYVSVPTKVSYEMLSTIETVNVTSVHSHAFYCDASLSHIVLSDFITQIGESAFQSCTGLSNVVIPANVTTIGSRAFVSDSALASVYFLGAKPSTIGDYAFSGIKYPSTAYYLSSYASSWGSTPPSGFTYLATFTISDLRVAGYTASELQTLGVSDSAILGAGYSVVELLEIGFTAAQLRDCGVSATQFKDAGYSLAYIKNIGFTLIELLNNNTVQESVKFYYRDSYGDGWNGGSVTIKETSTNETVITLTLPTGHGGYSTGTLSPYTNYTITKIKGSWPNEAYYSITTIDDDTIVLSEQQLSSSTLSSFTTPGFGYTPSQLLTILGYQPFELKNAGYTIADLQGAGYSATDLQGAGYTIADLQGAGYTDSAILGAGYTATQLQSAGYTATQLQSAGYTITTPTTPSSNVCFPAKTPILTNCGPINIEDIDPAVHTIRNKKIVAITKTVAHDKNLVRIAKHALGHLYPEKPTLISQNHKVFFQGQMVKAKHLVDEARGVTLVPYNGEILYNVLLEQYEKMQVNNLIVETLHPEHKVAKLYRFLQNVDAAHHGKLIALFNQKDREQRLRR